MMLSPCLVATCGNSLALVDHMATGPQTAQGVCQTIEPLRRKRDSECVCDKVIFQRITTVMCRHPEAFSLDDGGKLESCSPNRRASAIARMADDALAAGVARAKMSIP